MSRERERFEEADDEIGKRIKREIDARSGSGLLYNKNQMGRRHMLAGPPGSTMVVGVLGSNLNTITPCAACKLLRRRCAEECPFSPYFSPHEPQKFAAVHKVFGASNVSKLLMEVAENQRADAANSLVYEAKVRLRDPVYGCMGVISALQQQLQTLQAELNAVRDDIFKYKYKEAAAANTLLMSSNSNSNSISISTTCGTATSVVITAALQPPPPATPPPSSISSVSVLELVSSPASASASLYTRSPPPPHSTTTTPTTPPRFTSISTHHNVPFFD